MARQGCTARAAFRSALGALGEAEFSSPLAPELSLPDWKDEAPAGEARWIQAADAGVAYELRLNNEGPFRLTLGRSHAEGRWQLESAPPGALRVPADAREMRVRVTARAGAREQTLVAGRYAPPERLAFMGAPGHLVVTSRAEDGVATSHIFLHVLDIQGRGPTVVHAAVWCDIETD
jgi:hypothetical protein